jgi:hypothetical protein
MNLQHLVQMAASVANVLTVVVFGIGYYMMIRLYREWVRESRQTREAGGRPQVVVAVDQSHLPQTNIVVRNFNRAPAKNVSFHFAAPIESPDGTVISELPYFRKGLHYLEPEGKISRPWGHLSELAPLLRERGLENGIGVTVRYKDLAGESYESEWTLDPLLFEGSGIEDSKGMNDLVNAVQRITSQVTHDAGA